MTKPRFNIIDFIIIIGIAVVIFAGVYILGSKSETKVVTKTAKILITVEETGVDEERMAFYKENAKKGDKVQIGLKEKVDGIIDEVKIIPAVLIYDDPVTGEKREIDKIGKYDITFTVLADAMENDRDFLLGTGKAKVGAKQGLIGKGYSAYGTVIALKKAGGDE